MHPAAKLQFERIIVEFARWRTLPKDDRPPAPAETKPAQVESTPAAPSPLGFGVEVPFGPMLAIATLIYFLALHRWVDDYFANLAVML